ncbi:MAG: ice-binding family protein [Candidatus Uhrbacteria bacterium]
MKTRGNLLGPAAILSIVLGLAGPLAALAAGPSVISLGSASHFALLAKAGISTTGTTSIVGDIGVSPAAATYLTGFSLDLPVGSSYSTSPIVVGNVYAPGYADPTPANLTSAVGAIETAYNDGAGRSNPTATELGAGNIGGLTIAPGLYSWGTAVLIPSNVTLSGTANDVWIFQVAQTLTMSEGTKVVLSGGALSSHVFWIVAGQTTIGTGADIQGTVLDKTGIVFATGAGGHGSYFAQTAITLDANTIIPPSAVAIVSEPVVTAAPVVVTQAPASHATSSGSTGSGSSSSGSSTTSTTPAAAAPITVVAPSPVVTHDVPTAHVYSAVPSASSSAMAALAHLYVVDLRYGSDGADVTALQKFLVAKALLVMPNGIAYGTFGPRTRAALRSLQAGWRLPVTGILDAMTRAAINPR